MSPSFTADTVNKSWMMLLNIFQHSGLCIILQVDWLTKSPHAPGMGGINENEHISIASIEIHHYCMNIPTQSSICAVIGIVG